MTKALVRFCMMIVCGLVIAASVSAPAAAKAFDKNEWLEDLGQVRQAFAIRYANLEWAQFDNAARLSDLLDKTRDRIDRAGSDADARAAFDRLTQRLGDGHVHFDWAAATTTAGQRQGTQDPCRNFNPSQAASPLMVNAPGYRPLHTHQSAIFPAGTLTGLRGPDFGLRQDYVRLLIDKVVLSASGLTIRGSKKALEHAVGAQRASDSRVLTFAQNWCATQSKANESLPV